MLTIHEAAWQACAVHVCCLIKHTTGSASFQCNVQFDSCLFLRICSTTTIPAILMHKM